MKKLVMFFVVLSMLCSMVCMPAFADETSNGAKMYNFEEYGSGGISYFVKTSETRGTFLRVDVGDANTPAANPSFEFTAEIDETGYYDITYLAGKSLDGWTSKLSISVDGTVIGGNDSASNEALDGYGYEAFMPMTKYVKKEVWLTKGERTVSVNINKCTSQTAFDKYSFQLDYIEFTPCETDVVSSEEATLIGFEEYGTGGNNYYIKTSGTHGEYLRVDVGDASIPASNPSFKFVVTVEESGYYDISYIAGRNLDGWTSKLSIDIDGVEIGKNDNSSTQTISGYDYEAFMPMTKYSKKEVWLTKGNKIISVNVNKCTSQTAFDKYSFQLDYIEFVPSETTLISADKETKIEFEEHASVGVVSNSTNTGSGTGYVRFTEKTINPSFTVLSEVEKSGYYKIEYVTGYKDSSGISLVTFKLGDVIIGTNNDNSRALNANFTDTWNNFMPMSNFYKNRVWLNEGPAMLTVDVAPRTADGLYTYQADYIRFIPCSDEVTVNGENVEAFTCYDEEVSGTPVLALYNGYKLVCVSIGDEVSGEKYVTTSVTTSESFDKAKVFIWNNITDISAITGEKIINME